MTEDEREAFVTHEGLKMALRIKGTSLAEIARKVGVSRTTMSLVGLRKMSVPRVEQAIADVVGRPVAEVFRPIKRKETSK